jgi:hypothetical protein
MTQDIEQQIEDKKLKLQELIRSRPKANCSDTYSSAIDVRRETEIEELEEEIEALKKMLTS